MVFHLLSKLTRKRRRRPPGRRRTFESLETRTVFSMLPFGAQPDDTAEFLLGDVLVTVVLMESNEQISAINDNSETWTPEAIAQVKTKVEDGMQWWVDTLAATTDRHALSFEFDYTYADQPVATRYEPITRPSTDFRFWMYDFLTPIGFNQTGNFSSDIRRFNHAQRLAHETHWAFTIFVVNDAHDADGQFAPGGFSRAFSFPGGQFFVLPAARPTSTSTHELGHIFWARDEYSGGGSHTDERGYYNARNLNAWNNPDPQYVRQPSIMDRGACEEGGGLLCDAYQSHTSSESSLAMLGWRDADGDGVFDVLDVPARLHGSGYYDEDLGAYRFVGEADVQTLPNRNSSGLQNDITIQEISRVQYRFDGADWQTAQLVGDYAAELDLVIPAPEQWSDIQIRTLDDVTEVASNVFHGINTRPASTPVPGIRGFVWDDRDRDGTWDGTETGLPGQVVRLVDDTGEPLELTRTLEPDDHSSNTLLNDVLPGVTLTAVGSGVSDTSVTSAAASPASTGERVFASFSGSCGGFCTDWTPETRQLRIDFADPVTTFRIDAIGNSTRDFARLEAFDASGALVARDSSAELGHGDVETLTVVSDAAIAYAVARGHADSSIRLDRLRVGPDSETTTDTQGAYWLPDLDAGSYHVQLVTNQQVTAPSEIQHQVTIQAGDAAGPVDFGVHASQRWQNPVLRFDVNDDGAVTPRDALIIINDINARLARDLVDEPTPPFLDVNGDGQVAASDVLQVINELNRQSNASEAESGGDLVAFVPAAGTAFAPGEGESPNPPSAAWRRPTERSHAPSAATNRPPRYLDPPTAPSAAGDRNPSPAPADLPALEPLLDAIAADIGTAWWAR